MADPRLPSSQSLPFMEAVYEQYLRDPNSVSTDWKNYFQGLSDGNGSGSKARLSPAFEPRSIFNPSGNGNGTGADTTDAILQERVDQLIRNYRVRGHIVARVDPLDVPRAKPPELDPEFWGFSEADMDRRFSCESMRSDGTLSLREIIERLRTTYCRSIGVQFMHIDELFVRQWLQERMESTSNRLNITRSAQLP